MALQAGMSLSRLVFIVGAGYTGTILIKNNKLSEILGELQNFVKGIESGDSANSDADPIAAQMRWLVQEVRQLTNTRQVTVLNGSSSQTDLSSLILPAATLGAVGYGYMRWNGLSFSDLMYVSKRSMAVAVDSLKENLQGVHVAVEKAKKHLLQKIQNVDEKLASQQEMSKNIETEVKGVSQEVGKVQNEILFLVGAVSKLEDKVDVIEQSQNLTLMGVDYLVQFVDGKSIKGPQFSQEFRKAVKSRCLFPSSENLGLQSLLSTTEDKFEDVHQAKNFMRSTAIKAAIV